MADQFLVNSPYTPFTIKNQFKAISNGKVYIGEVDKDPLNPSQQIQVYVVDESGSNVPVTQPIQLNAGGFLVYNGQVSKFVVLSAYSIVVLNNLDVEMWRVDDVSRVDPDSFTHGNLKEINAVGGHDFIYKRESNTEEINDGSFSIGTLLSVSDKRDSSFEIISSITPSEITPDKLKTLPAGAGRVAIAKGKTINIGVETVSVSNYELLNSDKIIGEGAQLSVLSPAGEDTNVLDFNNGQADTLIKDVWFEGLGYPSDTTENGMVYDGTQNCRRNSTENSRFNGFSGAALRFSAGWGNRLKQVNINSCLIGLDFKVSPLLAGWSGSGFLSDSSYIATCGTGVRTEAIWNLTMLNTIIEDCDLPINQTQGATPQVWINTWFESNKQSPRLTQSTIFIGGRLEGGESPVTPFYGNMALPAFPFDYECITEVSYGISIFRDVNAQVFKADGQGVKFFKPHSSLGWDVLSVSGSTAKKISVGRGSNAIAGGITSETWGNDGGSWVDITKLVGRRHFNSFQVDTMNEYGVKVQGQGSSSAGGTGFTQVVISTGRQVGAGGGATEGGERWAWNENGHYSPAADAKFDIGFSAAFRVRDMRIANAPIVGSDYRIKKTPRSMSQELLDFALSVELKHFEFKDGTRSHSGVIITEEFLSSLDKVMSLDSCAAFCRDIFTDAEGNPITKIIHGVELGDLWQVRQDEWQNILLEALRRKVIAM